MGCGCNSNFNGASGNSLEANLQARLDSSKSTQQVSQFVESLNISIKNGKAKEQDIPTIKKYMDFGRFKLKVLGQKIIVSMTEGAIKSNRGNPKFPLAEQESKLASEKEKLENLETEYEELVNASPKVSFFQKNKITLLALAVGVSVFIGYKLYVKYRR
tara:strand:+ start:17412 stop:17888 length:477 start_codon:yes stop_codon:yes gene_type:complete